MGEFRPSVEVYLNDEESAFKDWYAKHYSLELYPGEPCAKLPDLGEIKHAFGEWLGKRRVQLHIIVCVEWDYPSKRNDPRFQDVIALAVSLADYLAALTIKIPAPAATAVLLVRAGLDRLCKERPA